MEHCDGDMPLHDSATLVCYCSPNSSLIFSLLPSLPPSLPPKEESKAIYCHVQKAACTSWKLLLVLLQQMRSYVALKRQQGVPPSQLYAQPLSAALQEAQVNTSLLMRVVHNRHLSGLRCVGCGLPGGRTCKAP